MAVNSRSYLQLAGLLPGVVSTANLNTGGHAGLANISANGARFDQNNLTLDGISNVDTGNNGDQLATISLDSVQEFKMLTSNYQAEYGRIGRADFGSDQERLQRFPRQRLLVPSSRWPQCQQLEEQPRRPAAQSLPL